MTDIFQEVEEDLRRDRFKKAWDKYGIYVIVAAVLIVAITAGWRGYLAWEASRQRAAGDRFMAALQTAESGSHAAAAETLSAFAREAPGGYDMLARFRVATEQAKAGARDQAIEAFRAIADDTGLNDLYRGLARIRTAYLLLDAGDAAAAAREVEPLVAATGSAWNHSAQEVMGLAAYAEDDLEEARRWFGELEKDAGVPADLRGRARLMLTLIESRTGGKAGDTSAASGETSPNTEARTEVTQ